LGGLPSFGDRACRTTGGLGNLERGRGRERERVRASSSEKLAAAAAAARQGKAAGEKALLRLY
jgi:hypothetical protein